MDTHNSSFDEGGGVDSRRSSEEFYLIPGGTVGAGSSLKEVMSPISENTTMTTTNGQGGASTAEGGEGGGGGAQGAEGEVGKDMLSRRASLTLQVAGAMPHPQPQAQQPALPSTHHHHLPHPLHRAASVKSSLASSPRFSPGSGIVGGPGGPGSVSRQRSALQRKTSAPTGVIMRPSAAAAAAQLNRSTDAVTQG